MEIFQYEFMINAFIAGISKPSKHTLALPMFLPVSASATYILIAGLCPNPSKNKKSKRKESGVFIRCVFGFYSKKIAIVTH